MSFKGHKHTEEAKKKMSEAKKKYWQNKEYGEKISGFKGKKDSEETKRKSSEAIKKLYQNPEIKKKHLEKIREFYKEHPDFNKGRRKGKKHSEETKRKMSGAKKRYWAERKRREKLEEFPEPSLPTIPELEPEPKREEPNLEGRCCATCLFFKEENNGKHGICTNDEWGGRRFSVYKTDNYQFYSKIPLKTDVFSLF